MREKNKKIVIKIQAFILMLGIVNMLFCTLESGVEAALYKSKGDFIPKSEVKYVEGDNEFTYTLKGTWSEITDYNTLNILVKASFDKEHSTSTNSATLKIKETDKVGLSQVSEPICKGK